MDVLHVWAHMPSHIVHGYARSLSRCYMGAHGCYMAKRKHTFATASSFDKARLHVTAFAGGWLPSTRAA
jgi:hypothetical protein